MKSSVLKLGVLFFIVGLIGLGVKIGATTPFFSDTENQTNNTISTAECFGSVGTTWADTVVSVSQGTLKNGSPITDPARIDPTKALGPNDWVSGTGTNFFSLGKNGTLTLSFLLPVFNDSGADLAFYEATNGRPTYPLEKAKVEVSKDGTNWSEIGEATSEPGGDGITPLSIPDTLPSIKYVRLTETTDFGPHADNADGFDLDAVKAIYGCVED